MWVDSSNDDSWMPEVNKPVSNMCVCVCGGGNTPVMTVCERMMLCCSVMTERRDRALHSAAD